MRQLFRSFIGRYFGRALDLRVRLFNMLAMAGTLVSLLMALLGLFTNAGPVNLWAGLLGAALSFALLVYSQRTGRYQLCYTITVVAIFLLLFPVLFFSAGGYHSGMPAFFVFAVVFTVFMLEGKRALLLSVLELAVYIGACLVAYYFPNTVHWFDDETDILVDIIIGFVAVSIALGISMYLHFRLYNEQQRKLAEQNAILNRINTQKTEFLSNISHELKTPLTVVSSHVQLGQQNVDDAEETRNTMRLIGGEVDRMALMVTQVLDVSRIDEGRMTVEPKRESIVEIIQATLDTYYPVFSKNRNKLAFRLDGDIPAVYCDKLRVMQVLVNLLSNAVRYTRGGEILVTVAAGTTHATITVADTGDGIAPERIPYLFQRYSSHRPVMQQPGEARSSWDTGTGLGLYICKYLVEAHRGQIQLESTPGTGTRVSFTLPLDRSGNSPVP